MKNKKLEQAKELAARFKERVKAMKLKKEKEYQRKYSLHFKWTTSKGRDTYGYNVCTLFVDGTKVAQCNGGGYDMKGTCFGNWLATAFDERLHKKIKKEFYGLSFANPFFNVMEEKLEKSDGTFTDKSDEGKTFRQLKEEGKLVDLDIHRAWHRATSKTPTSKHLYAILDGACGFSSMKNVATAIGLRTEWLPQSNRMKNDDLYTLYDFMKVTYK